MTERERYLEEKVARLRQTCIALGMQVSWAAEQLGMTMYEVAVASGTVKEDDDG